MRKKVDPRELKLGPIRRDCLSPDLEARVRRIYDALSDVSDLTYNQVRGGYLRDLHPEQEVLIWEAIIRAMEPYRSADRQWNRDLFAAVLELTTGGGVITRVDQETGRLLSARYAAIRREQLGEFS